jgi:hypothetical protein
MTEDQHDRGPEGHRDGVLHAEVLEGEDDLADGLQGSSEHKGERGPSTAWRTAGRADAVPTSVSVAVTWKSS